MIGFADMAERYDFIGVAPSGLLDGATPYWLAAPTREQLRRRASSTSCSTVLEAELCVDTRQVFSTGMSNGGADVVAARLPALRPDHRRRSGRRRRVLRSCAASGRCRSSRSTARADPIVTYEGGGLNAIRIADQHFWKGDVPERAPRAPGRRRRDADVGRAQRVRPEPVEEEQVSPEVRRRTWRAARPTTVLYVVDGGGHAWPGKPVPGFEDHVRPRHHRDRRDDTHHAVPLPSTSTNPSELIATAAR